jgi:hypothetical protein
MTAPDAQKIQQALDEAFAQFKRDNPELADALQVMNVSFAEYVQMLANLRATETSVSGTDVV